MAKKKKIATEVSTEVVPTPALPVPAAPVRQELVLEGDPEAQLAFASKAAKALMSIVSKKPRPVMIQNKQYLEYGDWQVLGRFYGATVEVEWTRELENRNGYEARVLVKRNGEVISSAEGMCTRDEKRWKTADEYAIRSMAQTRTAAKALRNAFGWVAELAGYSATPAEEMPSDMAPSVKPYSVKKSPDADKAMIVDLLKGLGHTSLVSKKDYEDKVKELTELELAPENYPNIINILRDKLMDTDPMETLGRVISQDKEKEERGQM